MEIVETSVFTRQITSLVDDEGYAELQHALIRRPDLGDLIPGSGGLRKVRWAQRGRGKRGGIRVIYYWYDPEHMIYMLLAYAKNEQENLMQDQIKVLRKLIEEEFGRG
ncbi:type II toxin-antitoxin system RelE/ParE family toxin [Acidihalobacter prosperus]|uniref:RelE/StbE replicon stabilization toxin n=1 Tax=Acidihalobacter prosperus TaxID=160660 RepID=A0A1A6C4W5_9GAMM|nr:type II toxin-antitoxin system RelE/ParE family toxin [Acidihalobacter prosperus]OBS09602.1 RelE/StbE replicon stabilization toxin [Acidihalobacter prosperus]